MSESSVRLKKWLKEARNPSSGVGGGRRTIQSSGRVRVIPDGSFHGEPQPFSVDTEAGLFKHYVIGWPLTEAR